MIDIVYEDTDLIAIEKPAGLLSVPGRGAEKQDSVQTRLRTAFAGITAIHRLDMATSGLLLLAKDKSAERHYKGCFARREVRKSYLAVCHGRIENDRGEIALPLRGDWPNRPRQIVSQASGKAALTVYRVRKREENSSRVALFPKTGRSHQLRVHLAAIGHPIVGDKLYAYPQDRCLPRLLLHAVSLDIRTPRGRLLRLASAVPF